MSNYYEDSLKNEKQRLLKKIQDLREERQRLQNAPIKPTTTYDYIDDIRKNSDTGQLENFGKKYGVRNVSSWEVKENRLNRIRIIDKEIEELSNQLRVVNEKLFRIEYEKPENVAKRQQEAYVMLNEQTEKQLKEERIEHEKLNKDTLELVEYLKMAGLNDLAENLKKLIFSGYKSYHTYITEEIDLQYREEEFKREKQLTPRERKDIKKRVIKLTKEATIMAKKYKGLQNLYDNAISIVYEIKKKGIADMDYGSKCSALRLYFSHPNDGLGYQCLGFYWDYNSKYRKDQRKHRIY